MNIRKFQEADADEVSALIVTTLRTTNIKDYSFEYIENDVKILQPYNILERAGWTHFYVACDDNKIVGIRRTKAACSLFLSYQNIRGGELEEKLLKRLNKMNIF